MFRRLLASLTLAASLALTCFAARARADAATPAPATTPAPAQAVTPAAAAPAVATDLTGLWRFDAAQSDAPPRPDGGDRDGARRGGGGWGGRGGMGGGGGGWGGGRRGGGGGFGGGRRGGDGGGGDRVAGARGDAVRPVRLPDLVHVTQTATIVSFEDSTGSVVQEITTVAGKDTLAHAPGAPVLKGQWVNAQLETERDNPRGGRMVQTYTLGDGGQTLVVLTRLEPGGDTPPREFKRVYHRAGDS